MFDFFQYVANVGDTILNYLNDIGGYFDQFFVWLQTWWVKMKLVVAIEFLKVSYLVATNLLTELGFASVFSDLFNKLPSELRYWGNLFKIPEGVALYVNCATTALVMKMSR